MSFWIASAVRIRPRRRVCSWVSSPDGTSVGGRRRWICISSVYCTSEQIIFSAADCFPLLLSSFFSFTLSFHCNLLYLRTQFIKLVVSAGLFLLWVGLFGGTNRKEKWTYITVISLSFSQPVCSSLLTWHLVGKDGNIVGIEASLYDRLLCLDQAMAMLWIPAPLPLWLSVLFQQQPLRPPC